MNKELIELRKGLAIDDYLQLTKDKDVSAYISYQQYMFLLESKIKDLQAEKDHYKHLYSEVKKQKDDVVEYIKNRIVKDDYMLRTDTKMVQNELLRMLGETDE